MSSRTLQALGYTCIGFAILNIVFVVILVWVHAFHNLSEPWTIVGFTHFILASACFATGGGMIASADFKKHDERREAMRSRT